MSELEPELPAVDATGDPAPDPAPVAPSAEPVAEPQGFNIDDPQVQARLAEMSQSQTLELLTRLGLVQANEPQRQDAELPEYDPYNPDAYFAAREAQFEARLSERFGNVEQFVASEQSSKVEAQIGTQIDAVKGELGYADGDTREIRAFADLLAPEMIQKFGQSPQAGQAAIKAAVEHFKARDEARDVAAVERYKQSLNPDARSTPYEPGVRGIGRPDESSFTSEADVARSWRERQPAV